MTPFLLSELKIIREKIGKQKRVLEIGSLNINGTARDSFGDSEEYIGIDLLKGKDVDIVMASYDIKKKFKKGSFDCVICCETLEHDRYFWKTLGNIHWVLKKGGYFILSVPGPKQKYHNPPDFYRFYEDAVAVWLDGYELVYGQKAFKTGQKDITEPFSIVTCSKKL